MFMFILFTEQGLAIRPTSQSADSQELQAKLVDFLDDKEATHWLQGGYTGTNKHLAMLSGKDWCG